MLSQFQRLTIILTGLVLIHQPVIIITLMSIRLLLLL